MDLRHIAIALGVFLLLTGGFLGFVIVTGTSEAGAPAANQPEAEPKQAALEAAVLEGYDVAFWGDGRPFVKFYDPGSGEYATQDIFQALFWQSNHISDAAQMGASMPDGPFDGAEAAYRLGLIHEHGLFGYPVNLSDALRSYRIARVAGHSKGKDAATRLERAGA